MISQRFTELVSEDEHDATIHARATQRETPPRPAGPRPATSRSTSISRSAEQDSPPPAPTAESPVGVTDDEFRGTNDTEAAIRGHVATRTPTFEPESTSPLPAPAPAIHDASRLARGHGTSRRRREGSRNTGSPRSTRMSQSLLPRNVLTALSSQTTEGPGNLLPSLYGYFSNEPAPTHVRPFSNGRNGQAHNLRAHATTGTSQVLATGDNDRHVLDAARAERVLTGGPSISNVLPPGDVLMSPGASHNAANARLRDLDPVTSVAFAPGALSDRSVAKKHTADVRKTSRFEENSMVSLTWMVDSLKQLCADIESGSTDNVAWSLRPLFGEERWRVEFVRDGGFGICLTCLVLAALPFEARLPAQVTIALRVPRAQGSASGETLWSEKIDHIFFTDREVITRRLPVARVLSNAAVTHADAVEVVVQVATGPSTRSPRAFELHENATVPKTLANVLEEMVDDASTGDVMVIVREKGLQQQPSAELAESVGLKSFVQPWQTGAAAPVADADELPIYVRDRVLWAHTPILRARSDFFATMLDSSFSEGTNVEHGGRSRDAKRPFRVLRIPDADYVTVYWLLRFLYANEVQFMREEDIRAVALDDHWVLAQDQGDTRPDWRWRRVLDDADSDVLQTPQKQPLQPGASAPMVLGDPGRSHALEVGSDTSLFADHSPTLLGMRNTREGAGGVHAMTNDPHPHPPMLAVPPASALAVYRVAHRYDINELCDAAAAHIIAHLTPENATNYLLCTTLFEQLQRAVQRYMYDHWSEVSASAAFERCCDEVSAGEWGPSAGRSLVALMRNMPHS